LVERVMVEMLGAPGAAANHRVRFVLHAPSLDYPIAVPFAPSDQMSGSRIMDEIQRVLNSNQHFEIGDGIHINFLSVSLPSMGTFSAAGGVKRRKIIGLNEWTKSKRTIITTRVDGNKFLLAALAVGRALARGEKHRYSQEELQKKLMLELTVELERAGVSSTHDPQVTVSNEKLTIDDLDRFGTYLTSFCIALYDANFLRSIVHVVNPNAEQHIDLLYDGLAQHVDAIRSMKAVFQVNFYCYKCHRGHKTQAHLCIASCCVLCRQPGCLNTLLYTCQEPTRCPACRFTLKTNECLTSHTDSACSTYTYCVECCLTYKKEYGYRHVCGHTRCRTCQVTYPIGTHSGSSDPPREHECFIVIPGAGGKTRKRCRPGEELTAATEGDDDDDQASITTAAEEDTMDFGVDESQNTRGVNDSHIFAFDIETDQSDDGNHKPNLLIMEPLAPLNAEPTVFTGYDCIKSFCEQILVDKDNAKLKQLFFAHFGSGFDFLPILRWLYDYQKFLPDLIVTGNKIISMTIGNKRFLDSFLFIPIPLSAFSKTFDIKEHKKGHFPHLLSTPENQTLIGEPGWFPEKNLFGVTRMSFKNMKEFNKWHDEQSGAYAIDRNLQYNFAKELQGYCLSDVRVLKHGILTFRALIQKLTGVNPFDVAVTAASACNHIYRTCFMPKDSIAILPSNGSYLPQDRQSIAALTWLHWVEETRGGIDLYRSGGGVGVRRK
jgi:hypothetical protein